MKTKTKYIELRELAAELRAKLESSRTENRELRRQIKTLEPRLDLMVGNK